PELYRKLRRPELEQFIQRVSVSYHLKPLGPEETDKYVSHRLSMAGGEPELFKTEAKRLIHRQSGGIPRVINILCETALVYGFADRRTTIDYDLVLEVIQDKIKGGLMQGPKGSTQEEEGESNSGINTLVSPMGRSDIVIPGVFTGSREKSS
ncbi:MAG: ExeA family protein, partial [Bacteroidota bacterium]